MGVLVLIITGCVGYIAYKIISSKLYAPTGSISQRAKIFKNEDNFIVVKFLDVKDSILEKIVSFVKLNDYARDDLVIKIQRLGMHTTPERIRAEQFLYVGVGGSFTFIIFQINSLLAVVSGIFTILLWFFPVDEMDKEIRRRNEDIMKDFPSFYNMMYYAYKNSIETPMREVVLDFLPNASLSFEKELNRFLDDEKEGEKNALRNLRKKIPLPYIIRFCDLIEARVVEGRDNVNNLFYFKKELDLKKLQKLDEELDKKVNRAYASQDLILIPAAILLLIHFGLQAFSITTMFSG